MTSFKIMIAIIGSGNVGGKLRQLWTGAGYDVSVAGRDNCADTVLAADVVALCVPWSAAETALASSGNLAGKIVIDCTNPLNQSLDGLVIGGATSAAERIQGLYAKALVVKAFNSMGSALLGKASFEGRLADGLFCGDNARAKEMVAKLISSAGLRPVDVGPLRNARYLEAMAMLWIDLAVNQKRGPTFAFSVIGWQGAR